MFKRQDKIKQLLLDKKNEITMIEEFIKNTNFDEYGYDEKIDLNENVFFRKMKYNLKENRTFKFENHHKMIDIHYSLKGTERMFVCYLDSLNLIDEYNPDADIEWYSMDENSEISEVIIKQGEMFIAAPDEAHEPDNIFDELEHEKVIFKIKI